MDSFGYIFLNLFLKFVFKLKNKKIVLKNMTKWTLNYDNYN